LPHTHTAYLSGCSGRITPLERAPAVDIISWTAGMRVSAVAPWRMADGVEPTVWVSPGYEPMVVSVRVEDAPPEGTSDGILRCQHNCVFEPGF
jgi:hypothetical protein